MRRLLSTLTRSFAYRNILAGLAGLVLGGMGGHILIVWSSRNAPFVIHGEHAPSGIPPHDDGRRIRHYPLIDGSTSPERANIPFRITDGQR